MEENQTPRFVDSFEELSINQEPQQVEEQPEVQPEATVETEEPTPQESPVEEQPPVEDYSFTATAESSLNDESEDLEREVLGYLSERLGRELSSFDDLNSQSYQVDESIEAIARFVQETGRRPEDWFTYQSLDPEGMDDVTAIMVDMSAKYQNLSQDEIRTLVQNKYKLDESRYDEEDIKLSKLQLKIDAQEAKRSIDEIRQNYKSNVREEEQVEESPFDEEWFNTMKNETMALEAVEFDLGQGQSFKFGLDESYTRSLVDQNANLENFFDQYISDDGDWNFDKFNADRAVLGNINKIMSAVYRKGLGDGQRGLLNTSANVQAQSPQRSDQPTSDPVANQIRQAMGMGNSMTFKL
jgi:hypothetical protein